jgi:hypothetical protein
MPGLKRGRPAKNRSTAAIPTPFGPAYISAASGEECNPISDSNTLMGQLCMFPGCKAKVPKSTCDTNNSLSIQILVESKGDDDDAEFTSLSLVSCEEHGHVMKARGLKKDMELHQYSHMRNVYTTLHHLAQRSCMSLLRDIGEL